jgi:hypothetical protein
VIDDNSAIGVMHLGEFPNGLEFSTFVLERYSYGFRYMSMDDYQLLRSLPESASVTESQVIGQWSGTFIVLEHPNVSLLTYPQPPKVDLTVTNPSSIKVVLGNTVTLNIPDSPTLQDMRFIGNDTIIGRWRLKNLDVSTARDLREYLEPYTDSYAVYYVVERT